MPWDGISPSVLRLTELIVQMAIFIYIAHLILSTVNVLHTERLETLQLVQVIQCFQAVT